MAFELDHTTKQLVQDEFIEALKQNNLMVVSQDVAVLAIDFKRKQEVLLQKKSLTPYQIEKYKLLNGKTANTIKNMVADGRIYEHESYVDKGVLKIMVSAIKRLKNSFGG